MFSGLNRQDIHATMKKLLLTIGLIAVFLLASCDAELPEIKEEGNGPVIGGSNSSEIGETFYISFNLSVPGNSSRAGSEDEGSNSDSSSDSEQDSWQFEQGSLDENNINLVRLFFYHDDNLVKIKTEDGASNFNSYHDWVPEVQSNSNNETNSGSRDIVSSTENVEKSLFTILSINFEGTVKPDKVVAIVNPSDYLKSLDFTTFSKVKEITGDFLSALTSGNFLMTNSVYLSVGDDSSRKIIDYQEIKEENLSSSPEKALAHPVSIYVERAVARLDFHFGHEGEANVKLKPLPGKDNVYDTGLTFSPLNTLDPQKIYVKFLGWGITSTPKISRLIKSIDASWTDADFVINQGKWNVSNNCRSYWAINPGSSEYNWLSYNSILPSGENSEGFSMNLSRAYLSENANPLTLVDGKIKAANPSYPTKVIFAAQLVKEDETPITITEYQGNQYTLLDLKKVIANSLDMYYLEEDKENSTVKLEKIKPEDIEFESAKEHGADYGPDASGTYYSYACLSEEGANKTWYHKYEDSKDKESSEIKDPLRYIDDTVYEAKIWNEGRTYFYFDLLHFDGTPENAGYYGVVRNNIYDAAILAIGSLGTPVYKPDEVIYPETPAKSGNMLIVTINKVEWRLTKQHFQVSW